MRFFVAMNGLGVSASKSELFPVCIFPPSRVGDLKKEESLFGLILLVRSGESSEAPTMPSKSFKFAISELVCWKESPASSSYAFPLSL